MVEPISAAAGLVLFGATLTYRIQYMSSRCGGANDRIRGLEATLKNTTSIIDMVDKLRKDETGAFSEKLIGSRLDNVFEGLQELFNKLNTLLNQYIPTTRARKMKWVMKGLSEAMALEEEIVRYHTALNLGFSIVSTAVCCENMYAL